MSSSEWVLVPALVGLEVAYAEQVTLRAQVEAVPAEPERELPPGGIVIRQRPQAGLRVPAGDRVTIWIRTGRGGQARPQPSGPQPTVGTKPRCPHG